MLWHGEWKLHIFHENVYVSGSKLSKGVSVGSFSQIAENFSIQEIPLSVYVQFVSYGSTHFILGFTHTHKIKRAEWTEDGLALDIPCKLRIP